MRTLLFVVSFLLSFLLFAVQPMATKMILPTLGGAPAVWNTAMFTFQCLLLLGYGYAHALVAHVGPRWQWRVHGLLLAASCVVLPLAVQLHSSDSLLAQPIPYLVSALVLQLGLPFLALSATQPLLQAWLGRSGHPLSATPYVLYSASNLGSFAGLIGYILLAEPLLALSQQSMGWSALYVLGMVLLVLAGYRLTQAVPRVASGVSPVPTTPEPVGWARMGLWVFLAFLPSSLSLGVTTYITTDVASVPLLWVVPLAIYLLSFVDAFRTRPVIVGLCQRLAPLVGLAALFFYGLQAHRFMLGFPVHLLSFAVLAFALHGWLARSKPSVAHLTRFYMCLSVGGAMGGVLNGLVAPTLLHHALEYPIVLLLASLTSFMLMLQSSGAGWVRQQVRTALQVAGMIVVIGAITYGVFSFIDAKMQQQPMQFDRQTLVVAACFAAFVTLVLQRRYANTYYASAAVALIMVLTANNGVDGYRVLFNDRNFFGVERVYENPQWNARMLLHDTTMHGMQSLKPGEALKPLSYYAHLGSVFDRLPVLRAKPMAVLGLGIGSMKCYAAANQQVDFYEINPLVKQLAEDERYFTQLRDCPGTYDVLLGDGRLRLAEQPNGRYGAIVLDAFSSDAIPAHLLTHEAMAMYLSKLAPGGVLLVHTTNRHLDLWPLIGAHAEAMGFTAYGRFFEEARGQRKTNNAFWVLIAKRFEDLAPAVQEEGWEPVHGEGDTPWSDQYINLLPYFKALRGR